MNFRRGYGFRPPPPPRNQNPFYNHERCFQSQLVNVQHLTSERIDIVWCLLSLCTTAKKSRRRHRKPRCTRIVKAPAAFDAPKALYRSFFDVGTSNVMCHLITLLYTPDTYIFNVR